MEADPSVVLEWLETKNNDLQLTALNQLCEEILFSDNVDVFCERFPPRCFIPALCAIFLDGQASPAVLEANARALSYYLDMHLEWCKYMSDAVISALSSHLECVDMGSTESNEFGQQLIKLLKIFCSHDTATLYSNGGLTAVLHFVQSNAALLHADVLQAGMELIRRLFSKANPQDPKRDSWINSLSSLMDCKEPGVADQALRAFANLVSRFAETGADPSPLANPYIVDCLLRRLRVAGGVELGAHVVDVGVSSESFTSLDVTGMNDMQGNRENTVAGTESYPAVVHAITSILITLCCTSTALTQTLLTSDGQFATTLSMVIQRSDNETVVSSVLRLINILLVLLYQGQDKGAKDATLVNADSSDQTHTPTPSSEPGSIPAAVIKSPVRCDAHVAIDLGTVTETPVAHSTDEESVCTSTADILNSTDPDSLHRSVIEAIKSQNLEFLRTGLVSGSINPNYTDHLGQTLLNWAASFGTPAMVELLCSHGANVNQGVRSPLDYAATFGRVEICRTLLTQGADPNKRDDRGLRPIDRARDHLPYPGCRQVVDLLEAEAKRKPV